MSSEGEGSTSYTAELATIALREKERLDQKFMLLAGEMEEVRTEKRKVDAVLKALNGSVGKSGPKPKSAKPFSISAAKREQALAFVTGNEQEITSTKLREEMGISGSYAASILDTFRKEGLVRLSATHGVQKIYRSLV